MCLFGFGVKFAMIAKNFVASADHRALRLRRGGQDIHIADGAGWKALQRKRLARLEGRYLPPVDKPRRRS